MDYDNCINTNECTDENKLYVERDKHLIYIYSPLHREAIRYNLKEKSMQKQRYTNTPWVNVATQYKFFRNFNFCNIVCKEEKFYNLLKESKECNKSCTSLSTFFARLNDVLIYENFIAQNVSYEITSYYDRYSYQYGSIYRYRHFKHGLEEYNKDVIKWFKKVNFTVTNSFEEWYFDNEEIAINLIKIIDSLDIDNETAEDFISKISRRGINDDFDNLITIYKYDIKALLSYILEYLVNFENITNYNQAIELLHDYYRMAKEIGRNVKKYPKYLRSMHDIITSNYNAYKKEYDKELFEKQIKYDKEFEGKQYCVIVPRDPKDVIQEGTDLNHCVGSYVDKIIQGKTYIMFLRKKETKEQSLVTLELINNKITQAKGACNRAITQEENDFLEKYCKKQKMELSL